MGVLIISLCVHSVTGLPRSLSLSLMDQLPVNSSPVGPPVTGFASHRASLEHRSGEVGAPPEEVVGVGLLQEQDGEAACSVNREKGFDEERFMCKVCYFSHIDCVLLNCGHEVCIGAPAAVFSPLVWVGFEYVHVVSSVVTTSLLPLHICSGRVCGLCQKLSSLPVCREAVEKIVKVYHAV